MKLKSISYTPRFIKNLKKLPKKEYNQLIVREKIFQQNPFDPRLKTHQLKGNLKGYWSFSITHSHRILFRFFKKDEVVFIQVGTHHIYR